MSYVLQTFDLCKSYKKHQVLKKVNMNIEKGDIYGFVGENGSGKTTIIRLITGLIHPNSGSFELFGKKNTDSKINEVKSKIGAVVENPSIYRNMSAFDNLKMQLEILGKKVDKNKIKNVLKQVGLEELYDNNKLAGNFSLGMRQRLGIAMSLLADPEFLILDEPMNGLDPEGIVEIRELILKLNKEKNITFLISSHILTELALVASKYGIISKGTIIKEISQQQLHDECRKQLYISVDNLPKLIELLAKHYEKDDVKLTNDGVVIYGDVNINDLLKKIIKEKITILSIKSNETSIEEYYISTIRGDRHA